MKEFETKKKFGQNFISDKNLLSAICDDADVCSEDEVLEIGAGLGTLTHEIAKTAKKVVSFEIDKDLEPILLKNKPDNVEFIFKDIVKTSLEEIESKFSGEYKIIANLPYYITSPIIFKFLGKSKRLKSLNIMVQKEVAERMVAKSSEKDYGVLSVSVNVCGDPKITRIVKRNMFSPAPNVDSAVVRIDIKNKHNIDLDDFFDFTKKIFSMRRKTLYNNLMKAYCISKDVLLNIYGEEVLKMRAEIFTPDQIVELYNKIKKLIS